MSDPRPTRMHADDGEMGAEKPDSETRSTVYGLHEPIMREFDEPRDGYERPPGWLIAIYIALIGWGGYYVGAYAYDFRADVYDIGAALGSATAAAPAPELTPFQAGQRVYANCQACHQTDGQGVEGQFPPLDGSERVLGPPETLAAILFHGLEGPLEVRGEPYDAVMPSWNQLSNEDIANVLTYIRGSWSNDEPPVSAELVAFVRDETSGRAAAYSDQELDDLEPGLVSAWAAARPEEGSGQQGVASADGSAAERVQAPNTGADEADVARAAEGSAADADRGQTP